MPTGQWQDGRDRSDGRHLRTQPRFAACLVRTVWAGREGRRRYPAVRMPRKHRLRMPWEGRARRERGMWRGGAGEERARRGAWRKGVGRGLEHRSRCVSECVRACVLRARCVRITQLNGAMQYMTCLTHRTMASVPSPKVPPNNTTGHARVHTRTHASASAYNRNATLIAININMRSPS